MPQFSVIIPVYNRPEEVDELLRSIADQQFQDIEIVIIEDGSTKNCKSIVASYQERLSIKYYVKKNTGQGFSRNFGAEYATGEWFIFFDSDCLIPKNYFVNLTSLIQENNVEAFCGPDAASPDFSTLQKAISYSMTSLLTTGGLRGDKNSVEKVGHLRSYNMIVKRSAFEALGGFAKTNMGEDMEFSYRFYSNGYSALISKKLLVYHKRRNSISSFFKQIFSFGRTRIILKRDFHLPIKLVHYLPMMYIIGVIISLIIAFINLKMGLFCLAVYGIHSFLIYVSSSIKWGSLSVGFLSVITSVIQLSAYGLGMISEKLFRR